MSTPSELNDPTLGTLRWSDIDDGYIGIVVDGLSVLLQVTVLDDNALESQVATARAIIAAVGGAAGDALRTTVGVQMARTHAHWFETALPRPAEIAARLRPRELTVNGDGTGNVFFDDDGLFRGHTVLVALDRKQSFKDVQLAG